MTCAAVSSNLRCCAPATWPALGNRRHAKAWAERHLVAVDLLASSHPALDTQSEAHQKKPRPRAVRTGYSQGQKLRCTPSAAQAQQLRQWIGAGRWTWNHLLGQQLAHYDQAQKYLKLGPLSQALTALRKQPDMAWLGEVPRTVLSRTVNRLQAAWAGFFEGLAGTRQGVASGKPQFRRRGGSQESATFQVDARKSFPLDLMAGTLRVPGLGRLRLNGTDTEVVEGPARKGEAYPLQHLRLLSDQITEFTIYERGGEWWVALTWVNVPKEKVLRKPEKTRVFAFDDPTDPVLNPDRIGLAALDASVVHGAVATSDGVSSYRLFDAAQREKSDRAAARRKKYQHHYNRKLEARLAKAGVVRDAQGRIPKGSGAQLRAVPKSQRQQKLEQRIASISLHELFRRHDAIQQFTTKLVREHHTLVVETLKLVAMAQALSRGFRRRMHEACMGEIVRQLKYKCDYYGRTLIFVDRCFPSSKRCSNPACHKKNTALTLSDRSWVCPTCHHEHDRDENAAFNLWQEGWRLLGLVSQQCTTGVLAAGSVVRGTQPWLDRVSGPAAPGFMVSV